MDLVRAVGVGYFPKELPPIFTSLAFANVLRRPQASTAERRDISSKVQLGAHSNLLACAALKDSVWLQLSCTNLDAVVKRAEAADALQSEDWLLAYEARARRWCAPKNWAGSSAWREVKSAGVLFMDIPDPKATRPKRWRLRRMRPAFVSTWGS